MSWHFYYGLKGGGRASDVGVAAPVAVVAVVDEGDGEGAISTFISRGPRLDDIVEKLLARMKP